MINLKALPAHDGDSFIIEFGEEETKKSNVIVDGGRGKQIVRELLRETNEITDNNQCVDLLVLTHIDADHIQGLLKLFELKNFNKECIRRVFFNSKSLLSEEFDTKIVEDNNLTINFAKEEISFKQGETFEKFLENLNIEKMTLIDSSCEPIYINDAKLTILSPDKKNLNDLYVNWDKTFNKKKANKEIKGTNTDYNISIEEILKNPFIEDKAIANGSSISFILEYKSKRILLLGDSHPSVILNNIKKINDNKEIEFDLVKISHHGSKFNTSDELLKYINCENYLVSTNRDNKHGFPHKEALSRIVKNNFSKNLATYFYFNYSDIGNNIFSSEERKKYNIYICEKNNNERFLKISI